jgi:predicted nucleotide-binding protein
MVKKFSNIEDNTPPKLIKPKVEAEEKIKKQTDEGKDLLTTYGTWSFDVNDNFDKAYQNWNSFNQELLQRLFNNTVIKNEYQAVGSIPIAVLSFDESPVQDFQDKRAALGSKVNFLESLIKRLEIIPEDDSISGDRAVSRASSQLISDRVFIVHGSDHAAMLEVKEFISKIGLNPVVLLDKPNEGKTLIEKFEKHSDVGFAGVILTPDDETKLKGSAGPMELQPRQNVILELGYFIGRMGREKVCPLRKSGIKDPSDIHGLGYVEFDSHGGWKVKLGQELKAAGLFFDFSKVLG